MERISCIIPAYNEERGIASVLSAVGGHPLLAEVIVVDDGSSDRTAEIVRSYPGITLLMNEQNKGKTATIVRGIEASTSPYVLLLDADLQGLTPQNITELVEPVRTGTAEATLSLRNYYFWRVFGGVDPLTGDRLLPKQLFAGHVEELRGLPSFALEVYINSLLIAGGYPFRVVRWMNVYSPIKALKHGWVSGMRGEVRMWRDITSYVPRKNMVRQFRTMSRLARQYRRATLQPRSQAAVSSFADTD